MNRVDKLQVLYHERLVGTMMLYQNRLAAFAYDNDWLSDGFSISPFSLPLEQKVFLPKTDPFEGLFGVFADSLPDGWGRLLVDRLMRKNGMDPQTMGNLDRLSIVGVSGMGALTYRPVAAVETSYQDMTLDEIAAACAGVLHRNEGDDLDFLFAKGGSSGGARPKILTTVDGEEWLIKFPAAEDDEDMGLQEYHYALCAKSCGVAMEKVRLFPSKKTAGYFGTKRFDRISSGEMGKVHMISAAGLLETSHRIPNLDYDILMKLTLQLTKSMEECEKLYRLMCFNVFAHNRDDHSKNFTYLYLESEKRWVLSPAYDLTYSNSLGGEHATTVHGNGANPGMYDILAVAAGIGIKSTKAKRIAEDIRQQVAEQL
jgi:serine/threonine-protein kinase HipA